MHLPRCFDLGRLQRAAAICRGRRKFPGLRNPQSALSESAVSGEGVSGRRFRRSRTRRTSCRSSVVRHSGGHWDRTPGTRRRSACLGTQSQIRTRGGTRNIGQTRTACSRRSRDLRQQREGTNRLDRSAWHQTGRWVADTDTRYRCIGARYTRSIRRCTTDSWAGSQHRGRSHWARRKARLRCIAATQKRKRRSDRRIVGSRSRCPVLARTARHSSCPGRRQRRSRDRDRCPRPARRHFQCPRCLLLEAASGPEAKAARRAPSCHCCRQ